MSCWENDRGGGRWVRGTGESVGEQDQFFLAQFPDLHGLSPPFYRVLSIMSRQVMFRLMITRAEL